ncbi:MAG TPA: tRNA pseudouridine(55) synthase TruB [Anaerolineales bacterium]|nr:tRNA pseudouridine(55) synthase TruB [Anaerolineales bacterium]
MKDYGLIIVDKPVGPTSHNIVSLVRRGTKIRKVGHAGTLDPRASGVLVLCLGAATRLSEYLSTSVKAYQAVIRFGSSTRTYDADGDVVRQTGQVPRLREIQAALPAFVGEIEQVPPPFSAIKVKGRKAYEMARAGEEVELGPRKVTIYNLDVVTFDPPDLVVTVNCSAGTYIRSLANELGEKLSAGAHLAGLRRTRAGPFTIEDAVVLPKLEVGFLTGKWEQYVLSAADALPDVPAVVVAGEDLERIRFGHRIAAAPGSHGMAKAVGADGELLAILEAVEESGEWHPRKVFMA